MASVDKYKHKQIGFINCPSEFDSVYQNQSRKIAIYKLEQDITDDEIDCDGKYGDILLGGGRGEAPVLRLSMPECLKFFYHDWDEFESYNELFKAFWTPTKAYILCNGFIKIGWKPNIEIEFWLAENVCGFMIQELKMYSDFDSERVLFKKELFE